MNRRIAWLVGLGAAVAVATACATLESAEPGVCGNGVIEGAEDCDEPEGVAARAGGACVRAGDLNACHYTCDTSAACPPTWGCDLNEGICRRAGGTFSRKLRLETGAVRLAKGDFDGDGRADLLLSQPSDLDGTSTVTGYFFSEGMRERARVRIPTPMGPPHVFPAALSDKALGVEAQSRRFPLSDLGFATNAGIGLLRGSEEEPFLPELLPLVTLPTASNIVPIPGPPDPKTGSSRGNITYGAVVVDTGRLRVVTSRLGGNETPKLLGELEGNAAQLTTVTAPAGRALCLSTRPWGLGEAKTSCSNALVYFKEAPKGVVYILDAESQEPIARRRPRIVMPESVDGVAVGDVDGDGLTDIVIGQVTGPALGSKPLCPMIVTGKALAKAAPSGLDTFEVAPAPLPASACTDPPDRLVGLAELNGDGVADFVYGNRVLFSQRGDAGGDPTWAQAYDRGGSRWTQMEVGDFDGDGRDDAVLATVGQSDLTVLRGATGEIRPLSVPTPEPVDTIVSGYFDGDRMLDVAYTTKSDDTRIGGKLGRNGPDAGASQSASSVYVLFGGAEHETVRVGKRAGLTLVNLRRPCVPGGPCPDLSLPDLDVLGIQERRSSAEATLYAVYAAQGRGLVALSGRSAESTNRNGSVGGRGVAFADLYGNGKLDTVRLKVPRENEQCGEAGRAAVEVQPDILTPGRILDNLYDSNDTPYTPLAPLALVAARVGTTPTVVAVGAAGARLRILGGTVPPTGTDGRLSRKLSLTDLTPPVAYDVDLCADRQKDSLSPAEKLSLLDVDGDGNDDLVFSDGGRVRVKGDPLSAYSLYPGVMVVLRGDGAGGFTRVSPEGMRGRSFARARLPDGRAALGVLEAEKVVFYTLSNGTLERVAGADAPIEDPNGRALEIGDFDGDGLDDLAVLGGGVLKLYAGERKTAKDGG